MALIYALAFFPQIMHLLTYEGNPIFTDPALSSMQNVAGFLVIQAPYPVLSLALILERLNPESLVLSDAWRHVVMSAISALS